MASEKAISVRIISRQFTLTFNCYAVWKRNATGISTLPMSRPFFARVSCECVFIRACARRWANAYCCEIIGIVMRDSIYFVYSAEKCFHLARPTERDVKTMEKEKQMECHGTKFVQRTETGGRAQCSPQAFTATKALNSTMLPSKRNNSRLSVNNDSFDPSNTNLLVLRAPFENVVPY